MENSAGSLKNSCEVRVAKTPRKITSDTSIGENSTLQFIQEGITDDPQCTELVSHMPCIDMYSTTKELIIEVEMPGIRREDIEVVAFRDTINIKAFKYECFDDRNINYVCMERSFGKIFRVIELPLPVNTSHIKAVYSKGILKITLPRVEEKRGRPKRVEIEPA